MKKIQQIGFDRRQFITKVMPACALTSLSLGGLPALFAQSAGENAAQEAKHKFDEAFPRKLTFNQYFAATYGNFISLSSFLEQEMGKEKAIEFLKKYASNRSAASAKRRAEQSGKNDFDALKAVFDPKSGGYKNTLIFHATENTDTVYELKVTDCIWANPFLRAKAGDLGFAAVCFGDYAWATAFNPKCEMVRDKTLMQGHDCCNHRYLWKG
ncbi:L-2-amino-thiazoline-4-carboxylic acid hydrolase [Acidobacteriota bacterium]